MSVVVNIFLNQAVPQDIARIFTQADDPTLVPLTLTNRDPAYYHQAVLQGKLPALPSFNNAPPASIDAQFIELTLPEVRTPAIEPSSSARVGLEHELTFLDTMGLLVAREDTLYISPLAWAMYGPGGPFQEETQGISANDRRKIFAKTAQLFLRYVIPGYMWRTMISRAALPDAIDLHTDMDRAMRGLQGLAFQLESFMSAPSVKEPSPGIGARIASAAGAVRSFIAVPPRAGVQLPVAQVVGSEQ